MAKLVARQLLYGSLLGSNLDTLKNHKCTALAKEWPHILARQNYTNFLFIYYVYSDNCTIKYGMDHQVFKHKFFEYYSRL